MTVLVVNSLGGLCRLAETILVPARAGDKSRRYWTILLDGRKSYQTVCWETERQAKIALVDLLLPYPVESVWRYRLTVGQVQTQKKGSDDASPEREGQAEAEVR